MRVHIALALLIKATVCPSQIPYFHIVKQLNITYKPKIIKHTVINNDVLIKNILDYKWLVQYLDNKQERKRGSQDKTPTVRV